MVVNAMTLVVDCGGLGIKSGLVTAGGTLIGEPMRIPTPYPLDPQTFVRVIAQLAAHYGQTDRVSVGMPGMIRHGIVVHTPHYITDLGPFTAINPKLATEWHHFDMQSALVQRLNKPVRVLNDAELHGYGVIDGTGLELVLTFGTGLGTALYDSGHLAPHLEVSHAPVRLGTAQHGAPREEAITFDTFIGDAQLKQLGATHWSDRVAATVAALRPVFRWDKLYLGGGNARNIVPGVAQGLGKDVIIVPNESALIGGGKLWGLADGA